MMSALIVFTLPYACEENNDGDLYLDPDPEDRAGARASGCEGKCSSSCQCAWTEIGCDSDRDCQSGLYCKIRPELGNRCLKKKDDGGGNDSGDCHEFKPGHGSYCTNSCQCDEGEGDCDSDAQCKSGLVCKQQSGTDFCVKTAGGGDDNDTGDCHEFKPGHGSYCSSDCTCDEGEGDCDKDADCRGSLVCKQQSGTDFCVNSGNDDGDSGGGGSDGELKIVVFDVGHGDSTLIVFPTGKTMLVDSGAENACRNNVLPFLKRHGIDHFDYYVETHPHGDHVKGAPVLRESGHINSKTITWDWKTHDYEDQFILEGTRFFITNAYDTNLNGSGANENSLAFRLSYNGFLYSAGGDEYDISQNRFLSEYRSLVKAHVRNTAHHMVGPVSKNFLVATDPYLFIVSFRSRSLSSMPSAFRSAIGTLEKNGRLKEWVSTGDSDVGHIVIRSSGQENWSYSFCPETGSCVFDYIP